jgi:hypothetical protein
MMAILVDRPWFWGPILAAAALAILRGIIAYLISRKKTYPRKARASGFTGNVREAAKFTLFGSGAGLLAALLQKELAGVPLIRDSMLSIVLISLVTSILNYWMASSLDNRLDDDGKSVELRTRLWEVMHGIISGLSLAAAVSLVVVIWTFAMRVG